MLIRVAAALIESKLARSILRISILADQTTGNKAMIYSTAASAFNFDQAVRYSFSGLYYTRAVMVASPSPEFPPVMRQTFPARLGISRIGLNFGIAHLV